MATAGTAAKNAALLEAASRLTASSENLIDVNAADMDQARQEGITGPLLDRLELTPERIDGMAAGLTKVAALADPIGEVTEGWTFPNGIKASRVRVPLGVVAVIYEARPNVTADAAALCLKSGNASLLRGSSYALRSNLAIGAILRDGLEAAGLPADGVQVLEDTSREGARALMRAKAWVEGVLEEGEEYEEEGETEGAESEAASNGVPAHDDGGLRLVGILVDNAVKESRTLPRLLERLEEVCKAGRRSLKGRG